MYKRQLSNKGSFNLDKKITSLISKDFHSGAVSDDETTATIDHFFKQKEIILCPHSAIGVRVGKAFVDTGETVVSLGTAHPAKFKETVEKALDMSMPIPPTLQDVLKKQESVKVIPPKHDVVVGEIRKTYLREN